MSADTVAAGQIRAFFERWQRLEDEKTAISGDLKELFAEAKGNGFDTKVLRKLFRDQVADSNERSEFEALYDLYAAALNAPRVRDARDAREDEPEHDADGVVIERSGGAPEARLSPKQEVAGSSPAQITSSRATEGVPLPLAQGGVATSSAGMEGDKDRQPIHEPETTPPAADPTVVVSVAGGDSTPSLAAIPVAANITPMFRINPATHFANSKGLPRLHGCTRPDNCAGSHRALCRTCEKAAEQGSAA